MASSRNNRTRSVSYLSSKTPEARAMLFRILAAGLALLFVLGGWAQAGPAGQLLYQGLWVLVGWGYWLLTFALAVLALGLPWIKSVKRQEIPLAAIALASLLGFVALFVSKEGEGWIGGLVARAAAGAFGTWGGAVVLASITLASTLIIFEISFGPFQVLEKLFRFLTHILTLVRRLWRGGRVPVRVIPAAAPTHRPIQQSEALTIPPPLSAKVSAPYAAATKTEKERPISPSWGAPWRGFPLSLLAVEEGTPNAGDIERNRAIIQKTLASFGIPVEMALAQVGPTVTQFSFRPADGVKLSRITALERDLALALAAHPLRIEAPIPGKALCGIEIPNRSVRLVRLRNLLAEKIFQESSLALPVALGRDVNGEVVMVDLARLPHLLIAGSTGAGKSVAIHAAILSLLNKRSPQFLEIVLIDPKRVELSLYEGIPHLAAPPITEGRRALTALKWLTREMDRRYQLLLSSGSRDITSYNTHAARRSMPPLPWIVVMIDELADIMAQYGRELEALIVRLAQMSRATGIHLVVSTQRPSVEVLTGLIKANITSRIAFQVASQVDSRTVLDQAGAEKLLGRGDMLWLAGDASKPRRLQGAYVSEEEVKRVVEFLKPMASRLSEELKSRHQDFWNELERSASKGGAWGEEGEGLGSDPLLDEAEKLVVSTHKASASFLQRRLRVGYARAARLLDLLEARGVVGPGEGAKPRDVLKPSPVTGAPLTSKEYVEEDAE